MTKRLNAQNGSGNVFTDVGFPPAEAHNLLLRAEMMMCNMLTKAGMRVELRVKHLRKAA